MKRARKRKNKKRVRAEGWQEGYEREGIRNSGQERHEDRGKAGKGTQERKRKERGQRMRTTETGKDEGTKRNRHRGKRMEPRYALQQQQRLFRSLLVLVCIPGNIHQVSIHTYYL